MTTESNELFELCKQVYGATRWENTPNAYYVEGHYFSGNIEIPEGEPYPAQDSGKYDLAFPTKWVCPIYTSDYLLEKLPVGTNISKTNTNTTEPSIYYSATCRNNGIHQGGTPLKALLKLTLKLYEEEKL